MLINKVKKLPDNLRQAVHEALEKGVSIDEITAFLNSEGEEISRSSVGRYRVEWKELIADGLEARTFASEFAKELASMPEDKMLRMNTHLLEAGLFRLINAIRKEEQSENMDADTLSKLYERAAKSLKNLSSAKKDDISATIQANDYALDVEVAQAETTEQTNVKVSFVE